MDDEQDTTPSPPRCVNIDDDDDDDDDDDATPEVSDSGQHENPMTPEEQKSTLIKTVGVFPGSRTFLTTI